VDASNPGYSGGELNWYSSTLGYGGTYNYSHGAGGWGSSYEALGGGWVICGGEITATAIWFDDGNAPFDPPPYVVIKEHSRAESKFIGGTGAEGHAANGLNHTEERTSTTAKSEGDKYTLKSNPGASVTIKCTPTADASANYDPFAEVRYEVTLYPIDIVLAGTGRNGDDDVALVGQKIVATLNRGGLSLSGDTTGVWSVAGSYPFAGFPVHAPNGDTASVTAYTQGGTATAPTECFFRDSGTANFACGFHIGGTINQTLVISKQLTVDTPTITGTETIGTVKNKSVDTGQGSTLRLGLFDAAPIMLPASGQDDTGPWWGIRWSNKLSVPSYQKVSGLSGRWHWVQTFTPKRYKTQSGVNYHYDINDLFGLDTSYAMWPRPGGVPPQSFDVTNFFYVYGDGPNTTLLDQIGDTKHRTGKEEFQTYVMFLPPDRGLGRTWVPIKKIEWYWQGETVFSGGSWGSPTNPDKGKTVAGTPIAHPTWIRIIDIAVAEWIED